MAASFDEKIKSWLTPGLISVFGMVSWTLINEIRSDVKALLASNAEVKVRIQNLEKRMDGVETLIYSERLAAILPKEQSIPKRKDEKPN
jgi:hypothetical protein